MAIGQLTVCKEIRKTSMTLIVKGFVGNATKVSNGFVDGKGAIATFGELSPDSKTFAKERICNNNNIDAQRLRYDNYVPIYAFNLTDYVL